MTPSKKKCIDFDCFNDIIVTIITDDSLVLTGQLVCKHRGPDQAAAQGLLEEIQFIIIELTCPLLVIPGNAGPALVQPFYVPGDRVRVNVNHISDIGPAHVCTP